ncbi:sickle tail protein homolog isoform X3 [Brachyhypopomus gauderio]|uniref:sickle tail protein homolog isoform X3 n=1 Tax=Brachyhypopomus gauderio TaxID=698409 RepID=UPI0040423CB4
MSKASRPTRSPPVAATSRLPSPRRETPASRNRAHGGVEKLAPAGGESTARHSTPANGAPHTRVKGEVDAKGATATVTQQPGAPHKPLKGNLKVTSPEDAEHHRKPPAGVGDTPEASSANGPGDGKGSRAGVPRRHTVGGARSSREVLAMQPSDMDKKREAFLEHLKQKYPHHASAIMGHQERLREQCLQGMLSSLQCEINIQRYLLKIESLHQSQSRSPKQAAPCPSPAAAFGDPLEQGSLVSLDDQLQGSLVSLDVMSECDAPSAFTRGSRSRASLPVVRSTNQTKDRSLGVLYLQYGDDTKQIRMPNEITGVDTVRALFVSAFSQQLSMKMLESPSTAIYVKDDMRNMYYELSDVRSIADQSCLKVYHKDPVQAFSHGARPSNGDTRMHREVVYAGRDGPVLMRQASQGPPPGHVMQGPMLPPSPHSMPPSPSRIPFGPRPPGPAGGTVPRERAGHALATPTRSASPCPSAILERRDVKPDEDVSPKCMALPARGEGLYADPYVLHHHAPPPDAVDHAYHRAAIRSYGAPGMPMEPAEHHSLFRQKSRKYTDSQLPMLGAKTPPPSPHRMAEMRMIDMHAGQPQSALSLERSSPVRQSFRKDAPVSADMMTKGRNALASPLTPVTPDLQGHPPLVPSDPQTRERMKAMEEQIASLTGLVQHALLKGPSVNGSDREHARDKTVKSGSPVHSTSSTGGSPVLGPRNSTAPPESNPASTPPISSAPLQVNLIQFRKNVSELRLQLQQMRQLQLQNQECVRAQIKHAEQEICVRLGEALRRQEDPSHKQRVLVEEDRHKYLHTEERVLTQLGDLEHYVESMKRDSGPDAAVRSVTLKEVEEGAASLRKVGESLGGLKGEFPALQARMRAVLRVEVEAVKFLKEEPHKLDSMLKRVKMLTDALNALRRSVSEGLLKPSDPVTVTTLTAVDGVESAPPTDLKDLVTTPLLETQSSSVRSEVINSNPMVIHHAQSSPVTLRQSQQSAVPPLAPGPPQQACETAPSPHSPAAAARAEHGPAKGCGRKSAFPSNGVHDNGVHDNGASPILFIEEIASQSKSKNRATSIEAAEKEWEEKRHNMTHYDGPKFERMLQEAEANMLREIPSLEVPSKGDNLPSPTAVPPTALEDMVEKPGPVPAQEINQPQSPSSEKPPKSGPEKASKSQLEKLAKAVALERPAKPNLTAKPSLEKGAKPQDKAAKLGQGPEKDSNKSPPPPPPRRNYPTTPTSTGPSTTRSADTAYTCRKEAGSLQEVEGDPSSAPKPKVKSPSEGTPGLCSPPPLPASAIAEEEDEGDNIMAELQNTDIKEDKVLVTDENGNNTVRQSPGVIYYVTAQISKETPEATNDHRSPSQSSSSQVSHVSASEKKPKKPQVSSDGSSSSSKNRGPDNIRGLPSALPFKQLTRSSSLKSKVQSPTEEGPGSPTQGKVHVVKAPQVQMSVEEKVESPTAVCTPVSLRGPDLIPSASSGELGSASQELVFGSSKARERRYEELDNDREAFLSPDLPGGEPPPPPDNIAFMITNTKVQALSTGEYQELVNAKRGNVQTVTVGSKPQSKHGSIKVSRSASSSDGPDDAENGGFNKKPVIIIFDEPMDIRSAYKRLSTVFECEEELERMLAEERIEEEDEEEEEEEDRSGGVQVKQNRDSGKALSQMSPSWGTAEKCNVSSPSALSAGILNESATDAKQDARKKFKFKFPKKQLAALTQALRTGTKTGKKTLQVVVYEDEEEADGTIRQQKEAKRFEIARSKEESTKSEPTFQETHGRTEDIRKSTYKTLDSLEQTIKQLETTISEMGPRSPEDLQPTEYSKHHNSSGAETSDKGLPQKTFVSKPSSKSSGLRKKPKPQILPRPSTIPNTGVTVAPASAQQNASVSSPTSRMPVPVCAKARQPPGTSDRERASKQQKLQDSQRQFRQANGSAKRSGGDHKSTSPTMPASKIPAFSSSTGKGAPQSDSTNPVNSSIAPSSSSSSSVSTNKPSVPTHRSIPAPSSHIPAPSSHIPSLSNGSLKLAPAAHSAKSLSLSAQTQNGRSPSSSSTHSPLSPTMLAQGVKSIRTIHTPSFVSYNRPHNGSAGKSAIPMATASKDTS